jgi:hypothetical protein
MKTDPVLERMLQVHEAEVRVGNFRPLLHEALDYLTYIHGSVTIECRREFETFAKLLDQMNKAGEELDT